ncbi:MAG: helix-turn-helix domain-containing protein [Desulfurellales bacterium]|nr:MAG: helix-turn-helix domain-containing protein [Desulfurellales bacterium]
MSQPTFYAVIPATVRYDKSLPPNAKLLYGEITAMTNAKGYCWATNSYFAELYGVETATVSRWISALERAGHLAVELVRSPQGEIIERRIRLQKDQGGIDEKINTPIDEKIKGNNTSQEDIYIYNAHARKIDVDDGNPNAAIERDLEETLFWIQRQKGLKTIKSIPETEWISAIESVAAEGISGEEFKNYYRFLSKLDWIQTVSPKIVTGQVERYLKRDEIKAKQAQAKAPEARPKSGIIW